MTEPRMPLHGLPAEQVLTALEASKRNDVQWQQGRTFGLVFDGGPEVRESPIKLLNYFCTTMR